MTFTVVAKVSGIELPLTVSELRMGNGRVFKNPIVLKENWGLSKGANLTLYKEQAGKRQIDRDVVKYLVDVELETTNRTLDTGNLKVSVSGSGAVETSGTAGLSIFGGQVKENIEKVLLPLRLATKARIVAIPAKIQGGGRDTASMNGLDQAMPELRGKSIIATLAEEDCDFITELAGKISSVNISPYQVPIEIFQDSFYNANAVERGLSLITVLESLFSQGSDSISFKLAYRTSCMLDFGDEKLYQTYKFIKEAYRCRNNLVHGQRKRDEAKKWFVDNVLYLEDIVRRALFMIVELTSIGINLIGEENIDKYMFEKVLTGESVVLKEKIRSVGKLSLLQRLL